MRMIQLCHNLLGFNLPHLHNLLLLMIISLALDLIHHTLSHFSYNLMFVIKNINSLSYVWEEYIVQNTFVKFEKILSMITKKGN
jgi:hypothetical protein